MSLSDLASLGSFVSGLAVVVTLIFLLLQMRQSDRNQRAMIQQARAARMVDMNFHFSDPVTAELLQKGRAGEITSDIELNRFRSVFLAMTYSMEDTFLHFQSGLIGHAEFESFRERMKRAFGPPGMRVLWAETRELHGPEFRAFIDDAARVAATLPIPASVLSGAPDQMERWRAAIALERKGS